MPSEEEIIAKSIQAWLKKFPDSKYRPGPEHCWIDWSSSSRGTLHYADAIAVFGEMLITIGADGPVTLSGPYEKPAKRR